MTKSEYRSNRSVAQTPKVLISVDDPRLSWDQIAITKATLGADFDIVGLDGKLITQGGTVPANSSGSGNVFTSTGTAIFTPPSINMPPVEITFGELKPTAPTDVTAVWSGNDLIVTFDWDYTDPSNATVSNFIIEMVVDGVTKRTPLETFVPNRTQTAQTLTLTEALNIRTFNIFTTNITSIAVLAIDPFYNTSDTVAVASVPTYVFTLSPPVITVSAIVSGYSVAYTTPTESSYGSIEIVEYESSSSTEPTGVVYSRVYLGTINPANIIASNTNDRWVKARFVGKDGTSFTNFSAAQKVTPTNPVSVDNVGPANVTSVSATTGIDTSGYLGFNAYADITWPAVSDTTLRGYRIRFSNDNGTTYTYANSPGTGTTYRLGGLAIGSTYKIAVATYDEFNNTSSNYVSVSPDVTVSGTPSVSNYITAGPFQFGVGVGGVSTNKGLYFDSSNYWYITSDDTARLKVGGDLSNYLYWDGQTFAIDGNITARGGYFAGNVGVISGGSVYSGTLNSGGALVGAGYILNSTGLTFNSSSVNGITTINGSTGKFITKSAEIGNWSVDENRIFKTSAGGQGNLALDSANGYIYVSSDSVAKYTAGINSASTQTSVAFWAGTATKTINGTSYPDPSKQTDGDYVNNFVVTMDGTVYARNAFINGTIQATDGYIGSSDTGWTIAPSKISANAGAVIEMSTAGKITLGNYQIYADGGGFKLFDGTGNVMSISDVAGTTDPGRLLLGQAPATGVTARQVEVAKDAQVSGSYSGGTTEDYRSGGLRNMYTITEAQFASYPTPFQNAQKGAVLLVYTP